MVDYLPFDPAIKVVLGPDPIQETVIWQAMSMTIRSG
jgi:hypothetical protein